MRGAPLRRSAALGFVFGWVAYAGGYHWLWRLIGVFFGGNLLLGAAVWLADSAWFAMRFALYAALYALVRRRGWPVAAAGVAPLLAVEWVYPLLFPVHLGHALMELPVAIQIADLGGPLLMTSVLALINAAVLESWRWWRRERRRPTATLGLAAAGVLFTVGYGWIRLRQIDAAVAAAPSLRVGVVQGNLGVHEKGTQSVVDHRRYLEQTEALLAAGDVDLVVWPETVYTRGLRGPLPISGKYVRESSYVPLLFGGAYVGVETGQRLRYNAALLVDADGVIRSVYEKNLLIPFTEYVPFADLFPALGERLQETSRFSAATEVTPLRLREWRISTPICYEVVRPAFVRRMLVEAKPHLLVTLANDSWFGDSQGPWMHLSMARFRAVEHRRYLVRATNSGISAVIDPAGRMVARSRLLTRENLRATVHPLDVTPPYTRLGDWPGWLAAAATALFLVVSPQAPVSTIMERGLPASQRE